MMKDFFKGFYQLFFPTICIHCGKSLYKHENYLCRECIKKLPRSYFHFADSNPVEETFYGRLPIYKATSFLIYQKGTSIKTILHTIKYKNNKELGYTLGQLFGQELLDTQLFYDVDMIVPVPLHPKKLHMRGYNQSEWIAKGIASILEKEVDTFNLYRKHFTQTQTLKNRYQRWQNVENVFDIRDNEIYCNKHILLIDDVITTGATIEACGNRILNSKDTKLSVASLAYAT